MASESEERPPSPSPAEAAVLLRGHLHPLVLVLRLIDGVQRAIVPLALGLVAREPVLLGVGGFVFLLQVGHGLVRYLTFHYVLTTQELVTREGILHRQERRIPIDRVQDLGFESTLLRRALGLAVVRVETASGQGVEAVLDSLARGEAEQLREALLTMRSARDAGASTPFVATRSVPEPEWRVFAADPGQLLLRGLTDLRLSAVLVAAFGAYQVADELGILTRVKGVGASFWHWLQGFPQALAAALLLGLVAGVVIVVAVSAAVGNWMVFHGFQLTLRADSLLCRYGLLTTRQKTLPRARVQRVRVEQTWLRRLLGVAVARADSAGAGHEVGQEVAGGLDVVVPLARLEHVEALLPAVLPGLERGAGQLRRASRRLVLRVFLRGVLQTGVVVAVLWTQFGAMALFALGLLPFAWLVGRLWWHNLGYGLWAEHLYLRSGLIGSYQVLVPTAKVQAVAVRRGPVQRLLGLAELLVYVAGGPPTRIPDLPPDEATAVAAVLVARAKEAERRKRNGTQAGITPSPA